LSEGASEGWYEKGGELQAEGWLDVCVQLDWLISFAQTFGFLSSSTFFPPRGY
jgi:hypothetical protein